MKNDFLLHVDHLSIGFRQGSEIRPAVNDSSFWVYAGKTLAIVGESGSGKSVSSLSILKLLHPEKTVFSSGRFLFDASILEGISEENNVLPNDSLLEQLRGKRIAMIFQEPMTSLNPVLTCGEQVAEVLIKHMGFSREKARQKTHSLFEEVKLPRAESMRAETADSRRAHHSARCYGSKGSSYPSSNAPAKQKHGNDFHNSRPGGCRGNC
jgi:peptide/nickel transport system ATP-binding protein